MEQPTLRREHSLENLATSDLEKSLLKNPRQKIHRRSHPIYNYHSNVLVYAYANKSLLLCFSIISQVLKSKFGTFMLRVPFCLKNGKDSKEAINFWKSHYVVVK